MIVVKVQGRGESRESPRKLDGTHSTVTDFARFLGLSTSRRKATAV